MVSPVDAQPAYDFERVRAEILRVPPSPLPEFEPPRLTPFKVSLQQATVGVLTTCGAYFPDQERLGETEDTTYRLLPRERDTGRGPDRTPDADPGLRRSRP